VFSRGGIPETRRDHAARIDRPGTLLLTIIILCLLLPLSLGPTLHWSVPSLLPMLVAIPLLWLLWKVELRQERLGAHPLLPPSLLRLPSVRFGLLIAFLFFSSWSGYMFVLALALQAGAGLSPIHAGNVFVAMGVAYFIGSLLSARSVAWLGRNRVLIVGCVIQMGGLLVLMATLHRVWPQPGIVNLAPATMIIGFGQAFIVGSFFRIGLADVPADQGGAGSAMLSTMQQACFGLGSALLGAVFAETLQHSGKYLNAAIAGLVAEFCLMLILLFSAIAYNRKHGHSTVVADVPVSMAD